MNKPLNAQQREYVFYHLAFSLDLDPELRGRFVFGGKKDGMICFAESGEAYRKEAVLYLDDIPVLFPGDPSKPAYSIDNGTLLFHHDLLRSAFYLLSGYREYRSAEKDALGRFPYEKSVQKELGIIGKPVVNYYFQMIGAGIREYCKVHGLSFSEKRFFPGFGLLVTHDIDRVDKYTFHTVKGKWKKGQWRKGLRWFLKWINPLSQENPYWNFDYMTGTSADRGLRDLYFFLNKDVPHIDSYYRFSDKRIRELMLELKNKGHEIGLHGGVRSTKDPEIMKKNKKQLEKALGNTVTGSRQHRLQFVLPDTMRHLETAAFAYDSTLGFAAHEGFRNSYCLPFKLYDFENERMIDVWEFPLVLMDSTLFDYRRLSYEEAYQSIEHLADEVRKFHGLFTLLFHQSSLDEEEHPGICDFYEKILDMLGSRNGFSFSPKTFLQSRI